MKASGCAVGSAKSAQAGLQLGPDLVERGPFRAGHDADRLPAIDVSSMIVEPFMPRGNLARCSVSQTGKPGEGSCANRAA
jgi:hypothetical protein